MALLAAALNLVIRARRGELPENTFRLTPMHIALVGFALIGFVNGVALAAPTTPFDRSFSGWVLIVDQLAFFTLALAYVRAIRDPRWLIQSLAVIAVVFVGLGVSEHYMHQPLGKLLFSHLRSQRHQAQLDFEIRQGKRRVRGSAEFALEFGWMCAALLPVLLASFSWLRRRWLPIAGGLAGVFVLAVLWSYSRSPFIGIALAPAVVLLAARNRRVTMTILGAAAVIGLVYLSFPGLTAPLYGKALQGDVQVRQDRLPIVAADVAGRPLQGVGIHGLDRLGIPSTDLAFELVYGDLGAVGVAWLAVVLLTAVLTILPGLRAHPGPERLLASASLAAVVVTIVSGATYDSFALMGAAQLLWLFAATGAAVAERATALAPAFNPFSGARALTIGAALVAGLFVFLLAPKHAVSDSRFTVLGAAASARDTGPPGLVEDSLKHTACGLAQGFAARSPGIEVVCREVIAQRGILQLRVRGPSLSSVTDATTKLGAILTENVLGFQLYPSSPVVMARPTWARTAPVTVTMVGFAVALMVPFGWGPRRRAPLYTTVAAGERATRA